MEDEVVLKALLFDVQGTATDFHSTVCAEAQRISAGRYPDADWSKVVQCWRAGYFATLDAAPARSHGWVSVRSVYRRVLDAVLLECGLTGFSDDQREELTLAWERLMPWPDVVPGLTRIKMSIHDRDPVECGCSRRGESLWASGFAVGCHLRCRDGRGV
jgi:2-haloacid dehalogenase